MKSIVNRSYVRRRRHVGYVAAATAFASMLAGPPLAQAGTYLMRSCNVPGERSMPVAPWYWVNATNTYANDECGSGGGFGLNAGAMDRGIAAAVRIDRPGDGPLSAISMRQVRLWMVGRLSGTGSQLFVAWSAGNSASTTT